MNSWKYPKCIPKQWHCNMLDKTTIYNYIITHFTLQYSFDFMNSMQSTVQTWIHASNTKPLEKQYSLLEVCICIQILLIMKRKIVAYSASFSHFLNLIWSLDLQYLHHEKKIIYSQYLSKILTKSIFRSKSMITSTWCCRSLLGSIFGIPCKILTLQMLVHLNPTERNPIK